LALLSCYNTKYEMDFKKLADQEILFITNPIMDSLMDGSALGNHQIHIRDFADRLKAMMST